MTITIVKHDLLQALNKVLLKLTQTNQRRQIGFDRFRDFIVRYLPEVPDVAYVLKFI